MNILNEYIGSSCVMSPKEFRQDVAIDTIFKHMGRSISKSVKGRKKELPNEDCLFVMTCKIYTLNKYMRAHPKVFEKGDIKK